MNSEPNFPLRAKHCALRHEEAQRGFALVAVLWLLLLLGVIGGIIVTEARTDRRSAASQVALVKGRLVADAAINRTILSLVEPDESLRWRLDGTPQRLQLLHHEIDVRVESESGKIDLNAASADLLASLLRSQGVAPATADTLAERVIAWRSPLRFGAIDETAEAYGAAGRSYEPRHAPFRSIDELRLVVGMTDDLQIALAPLVTVYSRNPSVDRQIASASVLRALSESGDSLAESQLQAQRQGRAAGVDRMPTLGEALTVSARIADRTDGTIITRAAVVQLTGDRRQPYWILSWH